MFCSHCGSPIHQGDQFCPNCGAPVSPQRNAQNPQQSQYQSDSRYRQAHVSPAGAVGFADAVKMFFTKYTDFNTRSGRSEFWFAQLFLLLVRVALPMLGHLLRFHSWLPSVWALVILIPSLALCVRRLHDIGKSGVYYLWILLPFVGWIILLVQLCMESAPDNQWGPNPNCN